MTETIKILVIDDSEDDRLFYRRTLKKCTGTEYTLIDTGSGDEGIARLREEVPDGILLDYSLPGHNGVEVLKRIRVIAPFVPIVMLTGQGNEKVAVAVMQEGAQNYISKASITPETLEHAIRMAIDRCGMEKHIAGQRVALEVFTRALAHDLKEPLRTIRAFAELVTVEEKLSDVGKGYFQHIQQAGERMQMLVDAVFSYTQLDDLKHTTLENCNTSDVLEEVKNSLSGLLKGKQGTINNAPLPNVRANRAQLAHIFHNIIGNAIEHCQEPVVIDIQAEEQEKHWLFSIRDNGPGISSEHFKKIFEPFKRLVHNEKGAGLGLAICKKIVESYGGNIWCESEFNVGSTFFFTLPKLSETVQTSPHIQTVPETKKQGAVSSQTLATVLLVDDRKADIELTQIMLFEYPNLHCNLRLAYGGKEALNMMCGPDNMVDLILLDINMPEMDGFEFLAKLRQEESFKHLPVIMYTGSTYEEDRKKAASLNALGYLVKPAEFDVLKPMIERASNVFLSQEGDGYRLLRV